MIGLRYLIYRINLLFKALLAQFLHSFTPREAGVWEKRPVGRPRIPNALRRNVRYQSLMRRHRRLDQKKELTVEDWKLLNSLSHDIMEIKGSTYDSV